MSDSIENVSDVLKLLEHLRADCHRQGDSTNGLTASFFYSKADILGVAIAEISLRMPPKTG